MKKRHWAIVAGFGVLALALLLFSVLSDTAQKNPAEKKITLKSVKPLKVQNTTVPIEIRVDGPLRSLNQIALTSEVTGRLLPGAKEFEEGTVYKTGQTILKLDNSEIKSTFQAQREQYLALLGQTLPDIKIDYPGAYEQWKKYLQKVQKADHLPEPPEVNNEKLNLFLTGRNVYSTYENLVSTKTRLEKLSIKAPFKGAVTEALVEVGSLVATGQQVGEFTATDVYEFTPMVSVAEASLIQTGDSVRVFSEDSQKEWQGVVIRKNAKLDPVTQRIKIFIRLRGDGLSPGMYLSGEITGRKVESAYQLDRKLIYEDRFTYVVRDSTLIKHALDIVHKSPETVIVASLNDGELIPSKPISGAYDGMRVNVITE